MLKDSLFTKIIYEEKHLEFLEKYKDKSFLFITDNPSSHHTTEVNKVLQHKLVTTLFTPFYSAKFNAIEYYWG